MAKVFLDTNYFIGLANRVPEVDIEILDNHAGFVSILSCHILCYVDRIKIPDAKTSSFISDFNLINLNQDILKRALTGPTEDLEDNIQLYSAIKADCEIFLTADKKLLKLEYFGKLKISSTM